MTNVLTSPFNRPYVHIDYKFSHCLELEYPESPNVDQVYGEIYLNDHSEEQELIKIGKVELHYYNEAFIDEDCNLYDAFDRSMDTIRLGNALIDYETGNLKSNLINKIGWSFNSNVLVIHEIMLFKSFRSKDYGKKIIAGIEQYFTGRCGYIALQSFPKQHDKAFKNKPVFQELDLEELDNNYESAQLSLNEFYLKCGFYKIENQKESFFIKNINPI